MFVCWSHRNVIDKPRHVRHREMLNEIYCADFGNLRAIDAQQPLLTQIRLGPDFNCNEHKIGSANDSLTFNEKRDLLGWVITVVNHTLWKWNVILRLGPTHGTRTEIVKILNKEHTYDLILTHTFADSIVAPARKSRTCGEMQRCRVKPEIEFDLEYSNLQHIAPWSHSLSKKRTTIQEEEIGCRNRRIRRSRTTCWIEASNKFENQYWGRLNKSRAKEAREFHQLIG